MNQRDATLEYHEVQPPYYSAEGERSVFRVTKQRYTTSAYFKYNCNTTSISLLESTFIVFIMEGPLFPGLALIAQFTTLSVLVVSVLALLPKFNLRYRISKFPVFGLSTNSDKQRTFFLKFATDLCRKDYRQVSSVYRPEK
jgi:hypothetical protein